MLYQVLDNSKWREEGWVVLETNSIMAALQYYLEHDDSGTDFDIRIDDVQFCGDSVHPFDVAMAIWIHWVDCGLDEETFREFIKLRPAPGGVDVTIDENEMIVMIYEHITGHKPKQEVYKA